MPPYHSTPLTGKEVRRAARAAVAVLEANGLDCCLFGSAACAIYGMENREPNDVDIIVLSTMDREAIKELLESNDHRFYLVPSANPSNTYCVLWFTLRRERACKVDILTPGVLSIPNIPVQRILYQDKFPDIPITPFLCLLLLKLRGWVDHREDSRQYMRDKVPMDEGDIEELLDLAVEHEVHLRKERWMPKWFVEEARERIAEYVQVFPYSASDWREIGLGNVLRS
ncbi:hypothetical protein L208DRAFT_767547 [Tricholoma matsutake]|nr:hypothetical protein L208DRAFT_1455812 [Tricholoma matsutake 945]KAF8220249.1 hypothetical protein L208DRAFT_767547 [Tricholoma matsutake 945]